jgi:uncharacterized protein
MRRRFFHVLAILVLVRWVPPATAREKGIDPALLAKAKAGDAKAQYELGNKFNYGQGVRLDYAQAAFWYAKSAERGDPDSQFQLGGLYHVGHGVPQDFYQAFEWAMKAAKQNHTDAEFFIATCYGKGWGVAKDYAQEMIWLRKAAEQGHVTSQYMLGWAYEEGIDGLPKDNAEAYFWLDLATLEETKGSDRKQAVKKRDVAASHLSPADLASAQERARKWFEDHPAQAQ